MDEFTEQISAYLGHMPMWPLALMGLIVVGIGINELVDRRRRISAAEYFRDTILESLAGLYPDPVNWPQDIEAHLYARLPAMKKAFVHFRQHVPQDQLKDYNKDWERYCRFFYSEVSDENISATEVVSGNDQDSKKSFHTLVSNLLRHIP